MHNQDIHEGFERAGIRDFLARQLETSWVGGTVEFLEAQIATLQKSLEIAKRHSAVQTLIEAQGWEDWDISDEIPYDSETYFPFVGTEDEYEEFLAQLRIARKQSQEE